MTINIIKLGPPLTESAVVALEQRLGYSLPATYRGFLLKYNGGKPRPNFFVVPRWRYRLSLVNEFNGIVPGVYNDLDENIELLEDRLPDGLIPIADDPGGNCIVLGLTGETRDKVYFWDHEDEPNECPAKIEDWSNIYWLADSFQAFLENLKEEDDIGSPDADG